ncbi:MAG: VacB/RNase II family 3'-5' exoribonuclease [Clostridia bacterium]|nr:VacB/RNase II family 3'-5' exoribonuclease [Clostridia bacterium]
MSRNNKKNVKKAAKKELLFQKVIGTYNAKHGLVFTDEGKSVRVTENRPLDDSSSYIVPAEDKDRVEIMITSYEKDKPQGPITKVLLRFCDFNVGVVEKKNGNFYMQPFGTNIGGDILISPDNVNGAIDGSIVTFQVVGKDQYDKPIVVVLKVFAHRNDANAFVKSIAMKYGLQTEFSAKTLSDAESICQFVKFSDMAGRKDKRDKLTITIDGKDTKDRDDAIRLEILDNGNYLLGVDIADVDFYVPEGSAIDHDAKLRGTSCYAGGQVLPMLPKSLSNGICSLNEDEDRLALSCTMEIDKRGCIVKGYLEESVINVDYNMTYDEIMEIFDGNEETIAKYEDAIEMINNMRELAALLKKRAEKRGYLEFLSKEAKLVIDKEGKLEGFECHMANEATRLIQFFMIAANTTVATLLTENQYPCIYRVHDLPDEVKIDTFCEILNELGYIADYDATTNPWKFFQSVIEQVSGRDDEEYLMGLMKRAQRKAKYSSSNIGHFGIAEDMYCHFTSPIRRYPDLDVHRSVKAFIHHNEDKKFKYEGMFEKDSLSSSRAEVKADSVEREVEKIYKCMYMKNHIGEIFTGKISGVSKTGLFVELDDTIEGFCYVGGRSKCNFNEDKLTLTDLRTNHTYRLGEEVTIKVVDANEIAQTIDFTLDLN